MRIAVIGCGGIGGTIAASLTRAGHDVTPVTGNATVATALATRGFRVRDFDGGEWSVAPRRPPVIALDQADRRAPLDLAIVATQGTTLEAALRGAVDHLAPSAIVLCCQNGLPEERAAAIVGRTRALGCVVGWGATALEPGLYARTSKGSVQIGRPFDDSPDPEPVVALLGAASAARVAPDLAAVRWSKLAINCATSTLGAVGGEALGKLLSYRFGRRLALEVFAEVLAVARGSGVRPAPVAGTFDIERIAITDQERAQKLGSASLAWKHSLLLAVGMKFRRMRSSMLYALERGRPPEIDHLNGEIVRRGRGLSVPTPVNAALVETVQRIAAHREKSSVATLRALHDRLLAPAPPEARPTA